MAAGPRVYHPRLLQFEVDHDPESLDLTDPYFSDSYFPNPEATPSGEVQQDQHQPQSRQYYLEGKLAIVTEADSELGRLLIWIFGLLKCNVLAFYNPDAGADILEEFRKIRIRVDNLAYRVSGNTSIAQAENTDKAITRYVKADPSVCSLQLLREASAKYFPNRKVDVLIMNLEFDKPTPLGSTPDHTISKCIGRNLQWPVELMENVVQLSLLDPGASVAVVVWAPTSTHRMQSPISEIANVALDAVAEQWAIELPRLVQGATVNTIILDAKTMVIDDRPIQTQDIVHAILYYIIQPEFRSENGQVAVSGQGITWAADIVF
ncbi:hypothetical protein NX059_000798 [Plenodomus lindquistii]|nr:hypothetical protein NX059_000798 [Plenodomus lindquistii]